MSDRAFDFLNSVMETGEYMMNTPKDEREYPAFFINRGLSQHIDCILAANEINACGAIDNKMHYDYLFHSIRKKKRMRGQWAKKKDSDLIRKIALMYKVNYRRATIYLELMSDAAKKEILTEEGR